MKIETALDWNEVGIRLTKNLKSVNYNKDLWKMLQNIDKMVAELSTLEVTARRLHKTEITKNKVDEINNTIDHLEKLILIAKLVD